MSQVVPATTVSLAFHPNDAESAMVLWHGDGIGERNTRFITPYDTETLPLVIRALDAQQRRSATFSAQEQALLEKVGLWKNGQVPNRAARIVGAALYQALGEQGQSTLREIRNQAISRDTSTTYVLRFPLESVHMAALPWELLRNEHGFVLLGDGRAGGSFERYINLDHALPTSLPPKARPHLLALLPKHNIDDATRAAEHQARLASWEHLRDAGLITFDEITPLTRKALSEYMLEPSHKPDIVHYFGHGTYNDDEGQLLFDTPSGGSTMFSAEQLRLLLQDVRLIVLHACHSAAVDASGGLLTGIAPSLSIVADAVVAMQLSIRTSAAARFSELFYEELLVRRRSIQEAVAISRRSLFVEEDDLASWYVPTLYIRGREQRPMYLLEPSADIGADSRQPNKLRPSAPRLIQPAGTELETLGLELIPGEQASTLRITNLCDQEIQQLNITLQSNALIPKPSQATIARIPAHGHADIAVTLAVSTHTAQTKLLISGQFRVAGQLRPQREEGVLPIAFSEHTSAPHSAPKPAEPQSPNQALIKDKRRRLAFLELQQARSGYNTNPEILMEIEDLRSELDLLDP